jgi:N-acetylmuramoyl-L-alanine amidase
MTKQVALLLFAFISLIGISSFEGKQTASEKNVTNRMVRTVIIDPGHGGHDAGARGSYSTEKDICLAVSMKLGKMIEAELPELKLLYTRTEDVYPTLYKRADFANENKGDLYICIHVNSTPRKKVGEIVGYKTQTYYTGKGKSRKKRTKQVPIYQYHYLPSQAKGTETYIWGAHRSDQKELAVRENAPMLQEENYQQNYGGIDPNSPEFVALSLLKTKQYFKRSATLAGFIQDELVKVGRIDRDVLQRPIGIWVLQATAMPSVLIETGFISNPDEEAYLNSDEGQNEISACIVRALRKYLTFIEQKQVTETSQASAPLFLPRNNTSTLDFLKEIANNEQSSYPR